MAIFSKFDRLKNNVAKVALAAFVTSPVWADDTEIFFADTGGETVRTNVLFIIDTSGSMGEEVRDENGNGTGEDRLEAVQRGFRTVLNELTNVNVGLMRFSNPGGPILYPVVNIDADISGLGATEVISRIDRDSDDAQELATGVMTLNENLLSLTQLTLGGVSSPANFVTSSKRDAEEEGSSFTRDSSDLDFFVPSSDLSVGVRFVGLDVPRGATVTRAQIEFTVKEVDDDSENIPFNIFTELKDTGNFKNSNKVANRIDSNNDLSVPWVVPTNGFNGDKILTADVSDLVTQVIAHPNWIPDGGEDDIVFVFQPSGTSSNGDVEFFTYDGASGPASRPTLYIEYYEGAAPSAGETTTGLLFRNLDIPRGVDITSAYLELRSDRDQSGAFTFSVSAEDSANAATYSSDLNDITLRPSNGASEDWISSESVAAGEAFISPNLNNIIQNITKVGTGWCGGNDLALQITGTEGFRSVWSHDGDPALAPKLVIRYDASTIPDGGSCYQGGIGPRVSESIDDVEETSSGNLRRHSSDLDLENGDLVGLRFAAVDIPKDATINRAYLELTQKSDVDSGNTTINIAVESGDGDAEPFTDSEKVTQDRTYGESVDWDITQQWDKDSVYESVDIKALVSQAVSNGGWSAGNAMAFKLTTSGSNRRAYTVDSSPGQAARLVVEFSADGSNRSTRKVREELVSIVNGLSHSGWTPVQDTLYEAAQYYTGGNALWGKKRGGGVGDGGPYGYTRVSNPASMVDGSFVVNDPSGCTDENQNSDACRFQTITGNATYDSPIDNYCQKTSHIVLLTDGFANRDHSRDEIEDFISPSPCDDPGTGGGGRCVKDLVKHMRDTDLIEGGGIDSSEGIGLKSKQRVITHTIGFNFGANNDGGWLREVAEDNGGGLYAEANNAEELVTAIQNILIDALKINNTFVAPVAAVNQFNRLNNLNDIYFAVFRPDENPLWPGNLKKYKLGAGNEVLDRDNLPAIDEDTGFFKDTSFDVWNTSGTADGKDVEAGGAASQIDGHATRKVYTYHENSVSTVLSDVSNQLDNSLVSGGVLTKSIFAATSLTNAEFGDLIDWIRGKDVPDSADRNSFNDPLHSRPVAVTYGAQDPNDQDVEIFLGSNGGGLHAFDAATGAERFVFFPEATLPIQNLLKENSSTTPHLYGIDGSIVPWVRDNGANGIDGNEDDFVRLFFGMRRGGSNYYSLDVTDRANPSVQWVLEGGTGDYAEMGQSWSTPVRGQIRLKDEQPRDVLFIAGGYDTAKDEEVTRSADSSGRALYIVDAEDGSLIWSGGPTGDFTKTFADMNYSIPSGLTVSDVDSDGLDDFIFVGDTGGQVWRFDLINGAELVEDLVSGGVIADLGVATGDNTEVRNRRFFHAPDVALTKREGQLELAVTIGSGYRPSPLSRVTEDRFFMLRQLAVFGPPTTYTKLTTASLFDATDNRVGDGVDGAGNLVSKVDARDNLNAKQGWYIDLASTTAPGEKVLSTPLTLDDTVTFITYTPNSGVIDCRAVAGTSKVYSVILKDATPAINFNELDETVNEGDRTFTLKTPSIIDEPVVICTGEGCDVFTGAERPPLDELLNDRITRTYWRKDR
ncbi:MAG: type IV pilus assembly protein PilY1 [Alcanivorax sp.]|jgi:type IV pilus assembly protein PilY1